MSSFFYYTKCDSSRWLDRALSVSIRKCFLCWGVFPDPRLRDVDPRVLGSPRITQNTTARMHVIESIPHLWLSHLTPYTERHHLLCIHCIRVTSNSVILQPLIVRALLSKVRQCTFATASTTYFTIVFVWIYRVIIHLKHIIAVSIAAEVHMSLDVISAECFRSVTFEPP